MVTGIAHDCRDWNLLMAAYLDGYMRDFHVSPNPNDGSSTNSFGVERRNLLVPKKCYFESYSSRF